MPMWIFVSWHNILCEKIPWKIKYPVFQTTDLARNVQSQTVSYGKESDLRCDVSYDKRQSISPEMTRSLFYMINSLLDSIHTHTSIHACVHTCVHT